jgi:hypothetical protein
MTITTENLVLILKQAALNGSDRRSRRYNLKTAFSRASIWKVLQYLTPTRLQIVGILTLPLCPGWFGIS